MTNPASIRTTSNRPTATIRAEPRPGLISHTEFASRDPNATRQFCQKLFGWEFAVEDGPTGEYHTFRLDGSTGGGIRALNKAEAPAAIPYVEVEDLDESERVATQNGAKVLTPRTSMDNGSLLVLQAPGGPILGLWEPSV
jgi:uncharacterized protein